MKSTHRLTITNRYRSTRKNKILCTLLSKKVSIRINSIKIIHFLSVVRQGLVLKYSVTSELQIRIPKKDIKIRMRITLNSIFD